MKQSDAKTPSIAVALKYDEATSRVPQVVATGRGHIAAKIIEAARDKAIPIEHDEELSQALVNLRLEQTIPPELYKAVATVIGFLLERKYLRHMP